MNKTGTLLRNVLFGIVLVVGIVLIIRGLNKQNEPQPLVLDTNTVPAVEMGAHDMEGDAAPAPQPEEDPILTIQSDDHVVGNPDAAVTWIEYSDFDCPFCARLHPNLQRASEELDLVWVYRHFPLPSHGPQAVAKSEASECVFELGGDEAFNGFTTALFENQRTKTNQLPELAIEFGIDKDEFETCMAEQRHAERVERDIQTGQIAGVTGTPGGIVVGPNGDAFLVPGALSFGDIEQIVDDLTSEL